MDLKGKTAPLTWRPTTHIEKSRRVNASSDMQNSHQIRKKTLFLGNHLKTLNRDNSICRGGVLRGET
ncbi:hypothetical protein Z948_1416 [Sulfitobacter donghicola DSW-25 = KCTC 12864 = JCM 14565]|nr:hypothetical protein Z948_1416 [Sulfitobacter donghicola DSW-25 = KCTC 12864 = JCM 14565]